MHLLQKKNLQKPGLAIWQKLFFYRIELEKINEPGQLLVHHTAAAPLHPTSFAVLQSELDKLKNEAKPYKTEEHCPALVNSSSNIMQ